MTVNDDLVKMYGLHEALILEFIAYFTFVNAFNKKNFINNKHWVRISIKNMFVLYLQALSIAKIRYAIDRLVEKGILTRENHNDPTFLRTSFYTFTENEMAKKIISLLKYKFVNMDKFRGMNIEQLCEALFNDITNDNHNTEAKNTSHDKKSESNKSIQSTVKKKKRFSTEDARRIRARIVNETNPDILFKQLKDRGLWDSQIKVIVSKFEPEYIDFRIQQHDFIKKHQDYKMKPRGAKTSNPSLYLLNSIKNDWDDDDFLNYAGYQEGKKTEENAVEKMILSEQKYEEHIRKVSNEKFLNLTATDKTQIEKEAIKRFEHTNTIINESLGSNKNPFENESIYKSAIKSHIANIIIEKYKNDFISFEDFCRRNE